MTQQDARRSSATTFKCRCDKAIVLDIQDIEGNSLPDTEAHSIIDEDFVYRVGDTVVPEIEYDTNRFNECASGIHFFVDRATAAAYKF